MNFVVSLEIHRHFGDPVLNRSDRAEAPNRIAYLELSSPSALIGCSVHKHRVAKPDSGTTHVVQATPAAYSRNNLFGFYPENTLEVTIYKGFPSLTLVTVAGFLPS
jgi:hypothetical protein